MSGSGQKRKHSEEVDGELDEELFSDEEGTEIDGIYIPPPIKVVQSTEQSKNTRLIITKITNDFFKSYAKGQVVGPFHKCFNSIVGPNGSGKSNVIDSMLFVFGYRSTKIRSKKVSVLLHNSEKYRNIISCTVAVHFVEIIDKDGEDYEIVPNTEFTISRTAHKDNSSFYQLNGRRVQFKEIAHILKKHGIDLEHNRFLILQGEVEQIAMMKCKAENEHETGLLEYLEDIIGTDRYKKPLIQLEERIEILAEQRTEKLNRLKLIENELEELRQPMEEAVGFLKTENNVISRKNILYQKNIFDLQNKLKDIEEERSEIKNAHEELLKKLDTLTAEKSGKEEELKQESAKYGNLEKKQEQLKEEYKRADKKDMQLQADMTQKHASRKKTKELLASEKKKLIELEQMPEKNEASIAECEAKEVELMARKAKLDEEKNKILANLRSETVDLQQRKEELQTDLIELQKVVDDTKSAFTLAEAELKLCVTNEENERNLLETLQATYDSTADTIKEKTKLVSELKKDIPLVENQLKNATDELDENRRDELKITDAVRKKRAHLEESRSTMQASKSRGRVLDALMQQKRDGNCPGLYGRLGDLGAIHQKYDVAISTACGPLDNIVVDTVATAQWCIEYLKKHGIGRATLIALEKQEHLRNLANLSIRTPENVPRLYDLIQIQDDTIKTAFYFALRDTLVADDLDQASRIAYGAHRYRVVTLKGDLIETTGTMSGGGKTVSRGRMGQSVAVENFSPKQLKNLESELDKLEHTIREMRYRQNGLEEQITTLQPRLREMKIDYQKFTMELTKLKEQQPQMLQQLKEQERKATTTKSDPVQVKKITNLVEKKRIAYENAEQNADKLRIEVDKITKEIKARTSDKICLIDKKMKDVTTAIDKCKTEITRLRVEIKTSDRNLKKTTEKIATMQHDIEQYETKLREMNAERERIEVQVRELTSCMEDIAQQLVDGSEEYDELKKQVGKIVKQENQLKSEKVDVDQNLKVITKKLNDIHSTINNWHTKLSQLKLQDIPNESVEELKQFTVEQLEEIDLKTIEKELQTAESSLKNSKPNLNAIQEYRKRQGIFISRSKELEEISEKRNQVRQVHEKLRNQRKDEFMMGFSAIRLKLREMYQMITLGGDADFEMVDTFDPFSEGIRFNVRPPKKSWKCITNLSGGEKTLSSLALVFALHHYKPSPLYVMDEIDAALDFKNVSIVGYYIKERTKNSQFIIISLRSNMFELSDNLIGIYKMFNCTQTITIDPKHYENQHEDEPQGNNANVGINLNSNEMNRNNSQSLDSIDSQLDVEHASSPNTTVLSNSRNSSEYESMIEGNPQNDEIINDSFEENMDIED